MACPACSNLLGGEEEKRGKGRQRECVKERKEYSYHAKKSCLTIILSLIQGKFCGFLNYYYQPSSPFQNSLNSYLNMACQFPFISDLNAFAGSETSKWGTGSWTSVPVHCRVKRRLINARAWEAVSWPFHTAAAERYLDVHYINRRRDVFREEDDIHQMNKTCTWLWKSVEDGWHLE